MQQQWHNSGGGADSSCMFKQKPQAVHIPDRPENRSGVFLFKKKTHKKYTPTEQQQADATPDDKMLSWTWRHQRDRSQLFHFLFWRQQSGEKCGNSFSFSSFLFSVWVLRFRKGVSGQCESVYWLFDQLGDQEEAVETTDCYCNIWYLLREIF